MRANRGLCCGLALAFGLALSANVRTADLYVSPGGAGTGDYGSWATAAGSVEAAGDGDRIFVADGVYELGADSPVVIADKSLMLVGNPDDRSKVVLDGGGTRAGISATYTAARKSLDVRGFTFRNFSSATSGGAMHVNFKGKNATDFRVFVGGCYFADNRSEVAGAAIYMLGKESAADKIEVADCEFYGNTAINGGALMFSYCVLEMRGCKLLNNSASGNPGGGALYANVCYSEIMDCSFIGNSVVGFVEGKNNGGGAANIYQGEAVLTRCLFEGNSAYETKGGAILNRGYIEANNCVFRGNMDNPLGGASSNGSAIYNYSSAPGLLLRNSLVVGNGAEGGASYAITGGNRCTGTYEIVNSTIVGNRGGGVFISPKLESVCRIENSVIVNNMRSSVANHSGLNGIGDRVMRNSCTTPLPAGANDGGGNISADPLFAAPDSGDYRLRSSSPCIDAGLFLDWMPGARDLGGAPRLDRNSGVPDMGCHEYMPPGSLFMVRSGRVARGWGAEDEGGALLKAGFGAGAPAADAGRASFA